MKEQQTANTGVQAWDKVLSLALELPFVKVDRDSFLRSELRGYCTPEEMDAAIACPPAVHRKKLHQLSHQSCHRTLHCCRSSRWICPFRYNPC